MDKVPDFSALCALGYSLDDSEQNLCFPDGERVMQRAYERIVSYTMPYGDMAMMARPIDELDGEDSSSTDLAGDVLFNQLIGMDPARALIFLALRRRQRRGDVAGLRRGLIIATAYQKGEICEGDALWHFTADLERPSSSKELEAFKASLSESRPLSSGFSSAAPTS